MLNVWPVKISSCTRFLFFLMTIRIAQPKPYIVFFVLQKNVGAQRNTGRTTMDTKAKKTIG